MKIIVPIDGSEYSRGTLAFLASRKTLLAEGPVIDFINVQPELPARAASLMSEEALAGYYEEESANAFAAAGTLPTATRATRADLVGQPAQVIAEEAVNRNADLIVMGSHGMSDVAELLFGSVTMGVLARTKVPLLILRNTPAPVDTGAKVLFCVDGSDESREAVKYALARKAIFGTAPKFCLVHVSPTTVSQGADVAESSSSDSLEQEVDALKAAFAATGIVPEEVTLTGTPGDAIAAFAHDKNASFIVMGSHGYGRIRSLLLGSTALRIASQCKVPLLIVR